MVTSWAHSMKTFALPFLLISVLTLIGVASTLAKEGL
ncbi:MAG: hypothetical protein M2R46_05096 [Verrucomicrobia subdivision 3 bacterium]|nr:hypothetical protein [Limisphaerales bacterium]